MTETDKPDETTDDKSKRRGDREPIKQGIYRTETQAAVAADRGGDDDGDERELELPEPVDRVEPYLQADPEVSLETVNPEDRDRVLKEQREGEVGLTDEERAEHKAEAAERRDVRAARSTTKPTNPTGSSTSTGHGTAGK